jgi:hypothetical protein
MLRSIKFKINDLPLIIELQIWIVGDDGFSGHQVERGCVLLKVYPDEVSLSPDRSRSSQKSLSGHNSFGMDSGHTESV